MKKVLIPIPVEMSVIIERYDYIVYGCESLKKDFIKILNPDMSLNDVKTHLLLNQAIDGNLSVNEHNNLNNIKIAISQIVNLELLPE